MCIRSVLHLERARASIVTLVLDIHYMFVLGYMAWRLKGWKG